MSNLKEQFQKYVGEIIMDPYRKTEEPDTTAGRDLVRDAYAAGLHLTFKKISGTELSVSSDSVLTVQKVNVTIEKADDVQGNGNEYRIMEITVD